jgi:hypothetical protein
MRSSRARAGVITGLVEGTRKTMARLNRSSQHRPIEVIVGALRVPRLASSNRGPSEVDC